MHRGRLPRPLRARASATQRPVAPGPARRRANTRASVGPVEASWLGALSQTKKRVRSGQAHRARRTDRILETCLPMLQAVGCRKHADLRDENQTRARELVSDRRCNLHALRANEEGSRRGRTAFDDGLAASPLACFSFLISSAGRAPTCQVKANVKASAGAVRCCRVHTTGTLG